MTCTICYQGRLVAQLVVNALRARQLERSDALQTKAKSNGLTP